MPVAIVPIVRVQADDFDLAGEVSALTACRADIGAVVTFTGLCRDEAGRLAALELEHYPGMAEAEISRIAGEATAPHPARMALAGRPEGAVFDRLAEAQLRLKRGEDGTGKPLSCTNATLRQIAERRPRSLDELERLQGMGPQTVERFGPAFLEILREG